MKVQLPDSVSSLQELSGLILEIREYAKWFAANAIKERVHAKNATQPPSLSDAAHSLIREASSGKLLTNQHLEQLIADLEETKKTAAAITVTLAAPASGEVKRSLVSACRTHIADNALVTFKFNTTLCGGMVIAYGSHVFDWSFRRQILANRAKFTEVLRHV